jgi:hypothetical protein
MSVLEALRRAIAESDKKVSELARDVEIGSFVVGQREADSKALLFEEGINLGLRQAFHICLVNGSN